MFRGPLCASGLRASFEGRAESCRRRDKPWREADRCSQCSVSVFRIHTCVVLGGYFHQVFPQSYFLDEGLLYLMNYFCLDFIFNVFSHKLCINLYFYTCIEKQLWTSYFEFSPTWTLSLSLCPFAAKHEGCERGDASASQGRRSQQACWSQQSCSATKTKTKKQK